MTDTKPCGCWDICGSPYKRHVCTLDPGHDGPHSCHGRVFRTKFQRGDIVWQDEEETP